LRDFSLSGRVMDFQVKWCSELVQSVAPKRVIARWEITPGAMALNVAPMMDWSDCPICASPVKRLHNLKIARLHSVSTLHKISKQLRSPSAGINTSWRLDSGSLCFRVPAQMIGVTGFLASPRCKSPDHRRALTGVFSARRSIYLGRHRRRCVPRFAENSCVGR
jgi:hypothetical protein